MGQLEVLTIMEREKRLDLEELNILCPVSRGNLSKVIRKLIKQGYLKKERNSENKSKVIITYIKDV